MTSETIADRVVKTCTHGWYEIVRRDAELVLSEEWPSDEIVSRAAAVAKSEDATLLDDCEEFWVARVEEVAERHSAIRVGDYAVCEGHGSDVYFVRLG